MNDQTMKTPSPAKSPSENVTPTHTSPFPLPEFKLDPPAWGNLILNKEAAVEALTVGRLNLLAMQAKADAPNWLKQFDPLQGHLPQDPDTFGSSRFWENAKCFGPDKTLRVSPEDGDTVEVQPGHGGADAALVFSVTTNHLCGEWYPLGSRMRVMMRKRHGSLQAVLEKPKPEPVNCWTFVLTNEGPDGWCLASAYPGMADPDPNTDGLSEGSEISLEEAARRGLRVKA